jgi:hypothetical protein
MTRAAAAWLAAGGSAVAFVVAAYLRMNAAYGPFRLSADAGDWMVLWELLRHGQIASRVLLECTALGIAAAALPWLGFALTAGRRGR